MYKINFNRIRNIKKINNNGEYIIYWMCRDQRILDNWSLIFSLNLSKKLNKQLIILFVYEINISRRVFEFINDNIKDVLEKCKILNLNLHIYCGDVLDILKKYSINSIIIEQFPIKSHKECLNHIKNMNINIYEVDSHNIIPVWIASNKREYSARTIRKKLLDQYNKFNENYPKLKSLDNISSFKININNINIDESVKKIDIKGGYDNGMKVYKQFIKKNLIEFYENKYDDLNISRSKISPWIHFGSISTQKCMKLIEKYNAPKFKEQFFIRRELSDNFCYYSDYTMLNDIPEWCKKNIENHKIDKRIKIYSNNDIEFAKTDDIIWNNLQLEIINTGYLHGYKRMYWAKQIIYWKNTIIDSIKIAYYLNDKYFLDGTDPNGYVNILWCIVGLHDRPFKNNQIIGVVRNMSDKKIKNHLKNIK